MKKYCKILLALVLVIVCVFFTSCAYKEQDDSEAKERTNAFIVSPKGDYIHPITDEYAIYNTDRVVYELVKNENEVILKGTFYSYSIIEDKCIAIHNMKFTYDLSGKYRNIKYDMDDYGVVEDYYVIFYFDTEKLEEYSDISSFVEETKSKGLQFNEWYYHGLLAENIPLTDNSYIRDLGDYRGQMLFINDIPVVEGIIDNYKVIDDRNIVISFKDYNSDYGKEFETSNKNLSYEKFESHQLYKLFGIVYTKLTYSADIYINTEDGSFVEKKHSKW